MTGHEIVLMGDPRVAAVPVQDCGEPLVSLLADTRFLLDRRKAEPDGHWARVRAGLVPQLWLAEQYLRERGLRLLFVEGYRPLSLQRAYFEEYRTELAAANPDWSSERLHLMASRYVSPPEIAPHSCGAAVDVTLAGPDGHELDLGCRVNATPEESGGLCYLDAEGLPDHARALRNLLTGALITSGFVSYRPEFWHAELGTRFACVMTGEPKAWYGPLDDQPAPAPGDDAPDPGGER